MFGLMAELSLEQPWFFSQSLESCEDHPVLQACSVFFPVCVCLYVSAGAAVGGLFVIG